MKCLAANLLGAAEGPQGIRLVWPPPVDALSVWDIGYWDTA